MKRPLIYLLFGIGLCANLSLTVRDAVGTYRERLSEYGFFIGRLADQQPAAGVMPYALNAPLFSDHSEKLRFVRLPTGAVVPYNPDSVLQFPVGTAIVKTFLYPLDARNPSKGRRLLETRVLLHEEKGWVALPYVWDDGQSDAHLSLAGEDIDVAWKDDAGVKRSLAYQVPNMNQCKTCHEKDGDITPIGPSARQLNGGYAYPSGTANQLAAWRDAGLLSGWHGDASASPRMAAYREAAAPLADRAIAYLDANCAHCHSRGGSARTSGLYLDYKQSDSTAYGFGKTPVAAGRGSGGLRYAIVPGRPEESILIHRMASTDPGVMMPELGRKTVHREGVALVTEWIRGMR